MENKKTLRKSHFFESYLKKILRQVSGNSGITGDARQQLNSFLCCISYNVSQNAAELTVLSKKKTITVREVEASLAFILSDVLLMNSADEGAKAVSCPVERVPSRDKDCKLLFPSHIAEKFLRNFGSSALRVQPKASVYLSSVLEYLTADILSTACLLCSERKRTRITVRDLELTFANDAELSSVLATTGFAFLGGGVKPYIYSSLLSNGKSKKEEGLRRNRKRESRNARALSQIEQQQKSCDLLINRTIFRNTVRDIFNNTFETKTKVNPLVFIILQHYIEKYIVSLLSDSNLITVHCGRTKVTPKDIALSSYLRRESANPYGECFEDEEDPDVNITHHAEFTFQI